eukprot:4345733-Prymnesium_polylepis.1
MRQSLSLVFATLLATARGWRAAFPTLRAHGSRARLVLTALDPTPGLEPLGGASTDLWDERELWALEDSVPRYAVDDGRL